MSLGNVAEIGIAWAWGEFAGRTDELIQLHICGECLEIEGGNREVINERTIQIRGVDWGI